MDFNNFNLVERCKSKQAFKWNLPQANVDAQMNALGIDRVASGPSVSQMLVLERIMVPIWNNLDPTYKLSQTFYLNFLI